MTEEETIALEAYMRTPPDDTKGEVEVSESGEWDVL